MATATFSPRLQSAVTEYGVFWQAWPQVDVTSGERRLAGLELELIGYHRCKLEHVDPTCPTCRHVRYVLLGIADLMMRDADMARLPLICDIDSHSNSILCLPALGNRSAVSVSINLCPRSANGTFEGDLLNNIKTVLARYGIYQR